VHHSDGAIFVCEHVRGIVFRPVSGERFRMNQSISTFPSSLIFICQVKRRCLLQHYQETLSKSKTIVAASTCVHVRELPLAHLFFSFIPFSHNHKI
jgi:hypothetical protein